METRVQAPSEKAILRTENLKVYFKARGRGRVVHAVDGVNFTAHRGVTTGVVGESGSGKTTLAKTLVRLVKPTAGHVYYGSKDLFRLKGGELREFRKRVQLVFQDPYDTIDPLYNVYETVAEGPRILKLCSTKEELDQRVAAALEAVKITPWSDYAQRMISALAGGQRQRVALARALIVDPELLILDEPFSMLDASVKAEMISLVGDLKSRGRTFILISHDIPAVRLLADELVVMYLGQIVEKGPTQQVIAEPLHPYTQALIAAVPTLDPNVPVKVTVKGRAPSSTSPPPGCRFHPRCPLAQEICAKQPPQLREIRPGRFVACHFAS